MIAKQQKLRVTAWRQWAGLLVLSLAFAGVSSGLARAEQDAPRVQNTDHLYAAIVQLRGTYTIQQRSNGRFVDAHEHAREDYRLVTRPRRNNDAQRWIITPVGRNVYTIQQKLNRRFVDAHEHAKEDYRLVTRPRQNNDTQRWIITPVGRNVYTIQQQSNRRYVDAHEHAREDYRLVTRGPQRNNTQRWIILRTK